MSAAGIADMLEELLDFAEKIFSYFTNHPDWDDRKIVGKMTGEDLKFIVSLPELKTRVI